MLLFQKKILIVFLGVSILLISVFLIFTAYKLKGKEIRGEAPTFNATSITGKTINLDDYKGTPVLINFWATWCPGCIKKIESINSVAKDYRVINIATRESGTTEELLKYAKNKEMDPDIIINDHDGKLLKLYELKGVPALFIVDKTGQFKYFTSGYTLTLDLKRRLWLLE